MILFLSIFDKDNLFFVDLKVLELIAIIIPFRNVNFLLLMIYFLNREGTQAFDFRGI